MTKITTIVDSMMLTMLAAELNHKQVYSVHQPNLLYLLHSTDLLPSPFLWPKLSK